MSTTTNIIPTADLSTTAPPATLGRIHSFESCGTVDGPGIRFIVFFKAA